MQHVGEVLERGLDPMGYVMHGEAARDLIYSAGKAGRSPCRYMHTHAYGNLSLLSCLSELHLGKAVRKKSSYGGKS